MKGSFHKAAVGNASPLALVCAAFEAKQPVTHTRAVGLMRRLGSINPGPGRFAAVPLGPVCSWQSESGSSPY